MPLLNDLIETYDTVSGHEPEGWKKIAPVAHHYVSNNGGTIDIQIDMNGEFIDAIVNGNGPEDKYTLVAVTEQSCSRTSSAAEVPHALNDNLLYMTYNHYLKKGVNVSYQKYMEQLNEWCRSPFACPQIQAVYRYLETHDLIDDLMQRNKFPVEKDGKYNPDKYKKEMVRWKVSDPDSNESNNTWENPTVIKSWTAYYTALHNDRSDKAVNGIDGEYCDLELRHPKAISVYGNSKLISIATKEDTTLHFKGERFNDQKQILQIGYQDSQKIHNALGWLVDTQSVAISKNSLPYERSDEKPKYIVCWSPHYTGNNKANGLMAEVLGKKIKDTASSYIDHSAPLYDVLHGLNSGDLPDEKISVFMMDRSGDGRFSPVLYRSFSAQEFLAQLINWYQKCNWFFWDNKSQKYTISTPSLFNIARCAYGIERISEKDIPYLDVNDAVFKDTINTLLAVVLDGRRIPESLVRRIAVQASQPERFSGNEGHKWWNWKQILNTACGVIHGYHMDRNPEKGEKDLELDRNSTDRSYLFGRLLAVFDRIENTAMNQKSSGDGSQRTSHRDTNAMRLFSSYTAHPYTCSDNLMKCVRPYLSSLKYSSRKFYEDEMQDIYTKLNISDKRINRPLEPEYLMGFYLERSELLNYKQNTEESKNAAAENTELKSEGK